MEFVHVFAGRQVEVYLLTRIFNSRVADAGSRPERMFTTGNAGLERLGPSPNEGDHKRASSRRLLLVQKPTSVRK